MAAVFTIYIPTREYEQKLNETIKIGASTTIIDETKELSEKMPGQNYCNGGILVQTAQDQTQVVKTSQESTETATAPTPTPTLPANGEQCDEQRIPPSLPLRLQPPPPPPPVTPSTKAEVSDKGEVLASDQQPLETADTKSDAMDECMEAVLRIGLNKLNIEGAVWQPTEDKKFIQIVFPCESQERCEIILRQLCGNGIGTIKESIVSVVPCSVYYQAGEDDDDYDGQDEDSNFLDTKNESFPTKEKSQKTEFMKSIKARLTVAQVVDGVRSGAILTFDHIVLLIMASLIAAFGLMDSSVVTVIASMLVSPLMGPIMALCFGTVIRDMSLVRLGIISELVGLFLCIIVGVVIGLITSPWSLSWGRGAWPTGEMLYRGQARCLWVGMLVALPSGAGVALSLLGGNIASLIGVAISASLLPPAVIAGLLWANAMVLTFQSIGEYKEETILYHNVPLTNKPSLLPPPNYECEYSTNMAYENAVLGVISLCLTFVNIACIIVVAIAFLKIKEVVPVSSMPAASRFWREDIKITRDYNVTMQHRDSINVDGQMNKEWPEGNGSPTDLAELVQEAMEDDEMYQKVVRCTPGQYTLQPKISDRVNSMTLWGSGTDRRPSILDATLPSPKREPVRRRMSVMSTLPLSSPWLAFETPLKPFEADPSRPSFITEALNPHYTSRHAQDGGRAQAPSNLGNAAPSHVRSPTEMMHNNRSQVTKVENCNNLVGAPHHKHSVLPYAVLEEVPTDFKE